MLYAIFDSCVSSCNITSARSLSIANITLIPPELPLSLIPISPGTLAPPARIARTKTHWDYLLDEVQYLALDFRQELRWKRAMAKVRGRKEACCSFGGWFGIA